MIKRPCMISANLVAALTSSVMWFLFCGSFSAFKLHHPLILPWSNRTYTSMRPLHFMFPQTIASDCQIFAWLTLSHLSSLCSNRTPKNGLDYILLTKQYPSCNLLIFPAVFFFFKHLMTYSMLVCLLLVTTQ